MSPRKAIFTPRRRPDPKRYTARPNREVLRRLAGYLPPLKWKLLGAGACMVLATLFDLGVGLLATLFLGAVERARATGDLMPLNTFALIGLAVFVLKGAFNFGQAYLMANAAQRLAMRLRNQIFEHLQSLSLSFYDQRKTGQLMSSITNDVPVLQANLANTILDSVSAPLTVVVGVAMLFAISWPLTLLAIVVLPFLACIIAQAGRRMRRYTAAVQESLADISDAAEESLAGVRTVKSFANERYEVQRFTRRSAEAFRSIMRSTRMRAAVGPLIELIGAAGIITVLWFGGWLIVRGDTQLDVKTLTGFVLILQRIAAGARNLANINMAFAAVSAASERIFELLDTRSDVVEKPDAVSLPRGRGHLRFDRVTFGYRPGRPVLREVSFEAAPGQVVALVGPSGAGKSSIAALVPRFYDPQSGTISIDGYDVRDVTLASLRAQIGIVPQETLLFATTIRENIAYGKLDASEEEIVAAAKAANAHDFIVAMPEGYDTVVGERGVTLSGGQRQRLSIARALLRDPRILILDEATSSLDTESEALVQEALERLMADRTTLVIAHRLSTIRNADSILVIDQGRIVERGTHAELLARDGVYARLYRNQLQPEEVVTVGSGEGERGGSR